MDHHLKSKSSRRRAFTIIELLVVIGIIAVLAGIFFGVAGGVRERSKISRAETELSLLAQYLAQYKAHYGDFPHVDLAESNSADSASKREGEDGIVALYDALNGLRAVDGTALDPRQRAFIDRSKFDHQFAPSKNPPTPANPDKAPVALIDPWGNAYRYYYKSSTTWENPTYLLYSTGGSGSHEKPDAKGYSDKSDPSNVDNVYSN